MKPRRLLLKGATLVDGTGLPPRQGDLLIEDGYIAQVGVTDLPPDEVVDCAGLVVAPGFIDMHSHGDFSLPRDPEAKAKVLQGVTTEVIGNCGLGLHPSNPHVDAMYERIAPIVFGESGAMCSPSLSHYRDRLHQPGISVNAAPLIPHGNVRAMVMAMSENIPTATELSAMQAVVAEGMDQGAFGLSTGLVYAPGAYAKTDELVGLSQVVAARGGIYASHLRNEGSRLIEAVAEAIEIAERAGVSVQISHHKAAGHFNWGKVKTTLSMVDDANMKGLSVHSDVYPYTAGSTVLSAMFVPLWAFEGSSQKLLERLRDPATREKIIAEAKEQLLAYVDLPKVLSRVPKKWLLPMILKKMGEVVVINSVKNQRHYEGRRLGDIARERKQNLHDTAIDLLIEEETAVSAIAHVMSEDDVRQVLAHPRTMIGTDGFPLKEGKAHPRTFGTYPRVLEHYVARNKVLTLEDAIYRMTGLVAEKLSMTDRGVLRPGAVADVVVIDPPNVRDKATYKDPHNSPEGVIHVFVNGDWTVKSGVHTGARSGKVLSHRPSATS
ncbi:MAG: D-aminoacylase [Polyangiaceae bacterium]|nr:D-aminoacylase [Polyangiaceae bacterium]